MQESRIHPASDWLLRHASRSLGAEGLLERLCLLLREYRIPVSRASLNVHTLHPEIFVRNIVWSLERGTSSETILHFDLLLPIYKDSPVAAIYRGAGPIRRLLTGPGAQLDFPICRDLAASGSTDYLILPLNFSDERRTYVSFCTDAPGGFPEESISALIEIAPYLAVRMELASAYYATSSLLQLYLGRNAARRVLAGNFKRGRGDNIEAAIWYCDLRGFTEVSEHHSPGQVVEVLDSYFECVANAIRDSGGEILKFIGDGVLAIFDFAESDPETACKQAVEAALAALDGVERWNANRTRGDDPLKMGVALHAGSVLHGNVGSRERLDFTVIGPAVNEVSRLEPLCRTIGVPLVMSHRFVELYSDSDLVGMGRFVLRGVREPQEVFSLRSLLPRVRRAAQTRA
ncbi:MAG TPA: adenylate/guanylate cyclase domain-containing protein [Kofleriaceae bacterium]|nr:adenylate/guanylate cyclase domain-containing protein [Kofleriaceae bacterium]